LAGACELIRRAIPVSSYTLSEFDERIARGFLGAAQILKRRARSGSIHTHAKFCSYEPGKRGTIETFEIEMDHGGMGKRQVSLFSFQHHGPGAAGRLAENERDESGRGNVGVRNCL